MAEEVRSFKRLCERGFFAAPGALDAFSARIIESVGFEAIYLAGNALGLHLCAGQPFVTMTETVDCARQITGAITVPLIVDAGAGFGEPAHTYRAVRELERAGISAIHIDDQPYPKRASYHLGDGGLASIASASEKFRTAVSAKRHQEFWIVARTDALKVTGSMSETMRRCVAYVEAGVDALMVLNLPLDDLAQLRKEVPSTPIAWFAAPSKPAPHLQDIEAAGFSFALFPFDTVAAIASAVRHTWTSFRETGRASLTSQDISSTARWVQELIGMDIYHEIEARQPREP